VHCRRDNDRTLVVELYLSSIRAPWTPDRNAWFMQTSCNLPPSSVQSTHVPDASFFCLHFFLWIVPFPHVGQASITSPRHLAIRISFRGHLHCGSPAPVRRSRYLYEGLSRSSTDLVRVCRVLRQNDPCSWIRNMLIRGSFRRAVLLIPCAGHMGAHLPGRPVNSPGTCFWAF